MNSKFTYRVAVKTDVDMLMQCIAEEYGDTYIHDVYYKKAALEEALEKQKMVCFIVEDQSGNIAAMGTTNYVEAFKGIVELTAGVVREKYRRHPILEELLKYQVEHAKATDASIVIAECVTNHPVSQFLILQQGFIPANMKFNYVVYSSITEQKITKGSGERLMTGAGCVLCLQREEKPKLYAPKEHMKKIQEIYKAMKIETEIQMEADYKPEKEKTKIKTELVMKDETANVWITQVGRDVCQCIEDLKKQFEGSKVRTLNIYADMEKESALMVYDICKKEGFIFVGILPNTGEGNFIILTHLLGTAIDRESICVVSKFKTLCGYILDSAGLHTEKTGGKKMKINKSLNAIELTLQPVGRLDTSTAPELEEELKNSWENVSVLIMDFSELEYISSAGLRVLLLAQKRMSKQGEMIIRHANESISEVFKITGFTDILTIE